jgi:hypothetical protein
MINPKTNQENIMALGNILFNFQRIFFYNTYKQTKLLISSNQTYRHSSLLPKLVQNQK